jgi:S1-C subfamily serine protease
VVESVAPTSKAARAGLLAGDHIVSVAGKPVTRIDALHDALATVPPGDPALIEVDRRGTPYFTALP